MAAFPDSFSTTQITGHRQSPITQPGPKNHRDRACVTARTGIVRISFQKTRNDRNLRTRACSSIAISAAAARSTLSEKTKRTPPPAEPARRARRPPAAVSC
jgi:hypothetical protein